MKSTSRARLNRNENRATTKAMQHDRKSVNSTAGTVIFTEFMKVWAKFACSNAFLQFFIVKPPNDT